MMPDVFASRLRPGEAIIWRGRPKAGLLVMGRDAFFIPFTLFALGFVIFWEILAAEGANGAPFAIVGVLFIAVALYAAVGRFALDAWLRSRTHYAITNCRVMIVRDGRWSSFTALDLTALPKMTLFRNGQRRGTIRFGNSKSDLFGQGDYFAGGGWATSWTPALDTAPQFLAISDAEAVLDAVRKQVSVVTAQRIDPART